ncbi:hypothetical protein CFN78_25570 [Amycolatopsis antarctica]|uniref:Uncharacterized protein n=1 Tax=Amycolatopsis antarctica TaxID=1854586 RepID=A0A263CW32_9PSEU|nr:hypothetical protein CFN78_25570 [Amycolatopsis antarctica]
MAWHKESKRGKVALFVVSLALLAGGFTLIRVLDGDPPFEWATAWPVWLVFVVVAWLITGPFTYKVLSAGADWFQYDYYWYGIHKRNHVIKLYRLRQINFGSGPTVMTLGLADDEDNIGLALREWQSDRRMWDLVYNGILHSVAAGARVDPNARDLLELDQVPQLRFPDGPRDIDVTRLSDIQVWELMADPLLQETMAKSGMADMSAAQFREAYPTWPENVLRNPANPAWFADHPDPLDGNTAPREQPEGDPEDERWGRFYRREH